MSTILPPLHISPIDCSTDQSDLEFLALQLAVSKELQACPKLRQYLALQMQQIGHDMLNIDNISSRDSVSVHSILSLQKGGYEAYSHLMLLHDTAETIEHSYISKTRGE